LFCAPSSMGEVQAFPGRQRGSLIFHANDGFHYNLREVRHDTNRARLRCRKYKKNGLGCFGTANVSLVTGLLRHSQPHNHAPDLLLEEDMDLRRNMIEEARTNVFGKRIQAILNQWKLNTPNVMLASRFTTVRMKSSMYFARSSNYPNIPKTLLHLGLLLLDANFRQLCETVDRNDFIFQGIVGYHHDNTLSLVFASRRMLDFLGTRVTLHCDGTFKKRSRKPEMAQIWNIVTKYGDNIICLVRVLMSSRTIPAYRAVLQHLKTLVPNMSPRIVHCDFELAEIAAWRLEFPNIRISGCLWHFSVAFSTTAREEGFARLAKENDFVFSSIAALCAVPMLPKNLMWAGVVEIWNEVQANGYVQLRTLFEHFERYWLPRIDELCVFNLPSRTNNCSESDNRAIATALPQNRPNCWHLIGMFIY
ncbi:Tyrosine recombinase, partial [Frankliniella fusca]